MLARSPDAYAPACVSRIYHRGIPASLCAKHKVLFKGRSEMDSPFFLCPESNDDALIVATRSSALPLRHSGQAPRLYSRRMARRRGGCTGHARGGTAALGHSAKGAPGHTFPFSHSPFSSLIVCTVCTRLPRVCTPVCTVCTRRCKNP